MHLCCSLLLCLWVVPGGCSPLCPAARLQIRGLSGGQKVKLVLGAAMWQQPHILVLDEPTNYLDRESLGAMASAIKVRAHTGCCRGCCRWGAGTDVVG